MASNNTSSNQPSRKRPRVSKLTAEQGNASCSRCREKKIKCDTDVPKCRPCTKSSLNCVVIDSSTGKEYTRRQILSLQEQIHTLQESLQSQGVDIDSIAALETTTPNSLNENSTTQTKSSSRHIPKFIGEESGTGFIQYILHSISRGWKDGSFLQGSQEVTSALAVTDYPAHALPNAAEGENLVSAYRVLLSLTGFHVQHTFLQRSVVLQLYETIYQRSSTGHDLTIKSNDYFQLNMIFALASIDIYRKGKSDNHPFGYFTAALRSLNNNMKFESIRDIQGFLLIARFGLYYYIGCSVWEICQICLRICIELGLHQHPRKLPENLLAEQMNRRVFWECYMLDRISSITLGRPFGIEDSSIDIGLPLDAEDNYLEQVVHWSSDEIVTLSGLSSSNGEISVFNCCIRLRKIACRIHRALHFNVPDESAQSRGTSKFQKVLEPGETYRLFRDFFAELKSWRLSCPIFPEPQCPAQTQQWFQLLYEREKLTLVRAVIDIVYSRTKFPPKELLNPCHNTAVAIIHNYNDLRKRGLVTYSWSYLQLMLSCGLSVMFCVFVRLDHRRKELPNPGRSWLSHRWSDLEPDTFKEFSLQESSAAIDACAEIHTWMAEQTKEMGRYARFFKMITQSIQEKIKQSEVANTTPAVSEQHLAFGQSVDMRLNPEKASQSSSDQRSSLLYENTLSQPQPYYLGRDGMSLNNQQDSIYEASFAQQFGSDWPSASLDNTFEPLARQLLGPDPMFEFQNLANPTSLDDFSYDMTQNPLLEEFTLGLEGFW